MGTLIRFPEARNARSSGPGGEGRPTATVVILPVVRIERSVDEPSEREAGRNQRRRRRRPASRS
jgi:hypothetical protein